MKMENNWARDLSKGIIDLETLNKHDLIDKNQIDQLKLVKDNFDIRVPNLFLNEIKNNNKELAKQFIPSTNELLFFPEELEDPIGDERWTPVKGITHRYPDRVLLKVTYMCASYCRFCFRRYKVSNSENNLTHENFEEAIQYIKANSNIWEVILTGGDPLTLTDKALNNLLEQLKEISHLKVIRIHTRIPSVLPSRVTQNLIDLLKNTNKSIWIAAHINSVSEFTNECKNAISLLVRNGIPVLLQSVILKDINDTEEKLVSLLKTAVENNIKPYYIHYPDLAKGTEHFRIPLKQAIHLLKSLRGKISGLCIPEFIIDIPGGNGKIAVNPNSAIELENNQWKFESPLNGSQIIVKYP
ncbi:KamA family radical SAM protein [Silvanigrella paludirubra]|uniref:KamA family radical SAM protein n=1 Tax=Silvanigrella paludirubra TaxID=2499159 RepID=A0A6N6VQ04_9BACT|nr:KamA family radical SAM protein [Silvanigrella paludirubra]KAB8036523.1 KamA family radical SAM protein [Silvanigrella paludirubra]